MRVDEQQICLQNKINAWQTKKKKKWKIERYIQQPVTSSSSSATTIQQTSKSINRILLNEMKCWMEPQFYIASHIPNFIRLHLRSVTGIYIQVLLLFFFFCLRRFHIYIELSLRWANCRIGIIFKNLKQEKWFITTYKMKVF